MLRPIVSVRRSVAKRGPLVSRIIAALVGGYVLAALTSMAALALPFSTVEAVLVGTQASFLVYALAAIWVFAARSARLAWLGLLIGAVPLMLALGVVWAGRSSP
ncbi:MAG: DUF3649 domain-containing protein [Luteitalea sp.]|nr:DUF3649 domain-containing protein [Luteitalea sp.]